ncbi:MAG: acyl-CoA dehydrogenase family protein, partial [Thermoplasmata archaeon]|nr:acyl-CoA dehydrogenase family protein [Thermoplasmata archaeon]
MAISEADAGSDANAMLTTAVLNGEDFIINGSKVFISNGTIADVLIVFANC